MRYIYRQRGTFRATSTDSTHPISDPSYNLVRAHLSLGSVYAPAIEFGIRELNRGRDARACIAVSESAPGFVLEAHRHRWVLVLLILKRKARAKAIERTSLAQLHAATRGFAFKGTHRIGPFTPELCPYTTIPSVGTFPARKSVPVSHMAHFIGCAQILLRTSYRYYEPRAWVLSLPDDHRCLPHGVCAQRWDIHSSC